MKGQLVPVALLPRYSSFFGAAAYATAPMNVEAYCKGTMTLWRGPLPGTSTPTFKAYFEDSHDGVVWTPFNPSGEDPGEDVAMVVRFDLQRRWLRVRVVLGGTDPAVSCFAVGNLELRNPEGGGTP